MFVGYLSSRETAPADRPPVGRRDARRRLEPHPAHPDDQRQPAAQATGMTFDDIVADTDDGLLFETNRSWSIDDRRLNFQFATEICREIKGGKPGQLYRNGTYTGHHVRAVALDGRRRRRVVLADVGHAELRQGRARPDGPRRPRRRRARGSATCGWG